MLRWLCLPGSGKLLSGSMSLSEKGASVGLPDAAGREAILAAIRAAGSRVVYDALYHDADDEYLNFVE